MFRNFSMPEQATSTELQRLKDSVRQSERTKIRTYYTDMNPELSSHPIYFEKHVIPDHEREAFTRIRLSAHDLAIEKGRWSRISL